MDANSPAATGDLGRGFWTARTRRFSAASGPGSFYERRALLVASKASRSAIPGLALDVGCGSGTLAIALARLGYAVAGVDLSPEQVARARRQAQALPPADRPAFQVGGLDTVAASERFDLVCAIGVLPYVADQPAFLGDLARHVRPGGLLILSHTRAASLYTIIEVARHCRNFRPGAAWRLVLLNLLRTGIWSGGFLDAGGTRRLARRRDLDAAMLGARFSPVWAIALYNVRAFDTHAGCRSPVGQWLAARLGWSIVAGYRHAPA